MTTDTAPTRRKRPGPPPDTAPARRMRGFEAAGGLVRARVTRAAEGRGFAVSRLLTDWTDIVGPEIAAITRPVRITHARGGSGGAVLTLLCAGAAAPLVQMQTETIRRKVNACHGHDAVARIRLTQTAPDDIAPAPGFAEAQAGFAARPADRPGPPPRHAEALTTGVGDPDLRAALARLALNILSRTD